LNADSSFLWQRNVHALSAFDRNGGLQWNRRLGSAAAQLSLIHNPRNVTLSLGDPLDLDRDRVDRLLNLLELLFHRGLLGN
jgi:hypothetical protein